MALWVAKGTGELKWPEVEDLLLDMDIPII